MGVKQTDDILKAYHVNEPLEKATDDITDRIILPHFPGCVLLKDRQLDLSQATDRIAYRNTQRDRHIAKRVRSYNGAFDGQFTMRKAELDKILEGHADYMFYFFLKQGDKAVDKYYFIDLEFFRMEYESSHAIVMSNMDGTQFYAFPIYHFPMAVTEYQL